VNVLQAMILTDGPAMLLTPTYHVFMMHRPFRGATGLAIELESEEYRLGSDAVPAVHATAARGVDGKVVLSLTNIDPHRPARVAVNLAGGNTVEVSGTLLTATEMDAHNTFDAPRHLQPVPFTGAKLKGDGLDVQMPAKSLVVLRLQPAANAGR
jgi:alpha-L-arabinofuranosidase